MFATLLKRSNGALDAPAPGADPEFDRLLAERKVGGRSALSDDGGDSRRRKSGVRAALSLSRADLALSTARNELDRIGKIGAARGIDERHSLPGAFVRHMAVMATLVQGLDLAEARALAAKEREALGSTASLDATMSALTDALPASGASGGVAPILPDIVGEGAILAWLGPKGGLAASGLDPQARIVAAARVALAKASSTLVRTAQDFAAAGYAEPVHWLEALAGAPETDIGALMEIADALPHQTLALREMAAALTARIVQSLEEPAAAEAKAGYRFSGPVALSPTSLNNLGNRLSELGRREDALAAAQEAVEICRRLAAERPDAFRPDLAGSLNNLGAMLQRTRAARGRARGGAGGDRHLSPPRRRTAGRVPARSGDVAQQSRRNGSANSGGARTRSRRRRRRPTFTAASPPNGRTRSGPIWRCRSTISAIA